MVRWSVLLVAVGCGRLGFDPVDHGTMPDAPETTCWPAWQQHAFTVGAPRELTELRPGATAGDPFPSVDGLTLYLGSDSTADIYYATRVNLTDPWTDRGAVAGVNSTAADSKLAVTEDGLLGVLSSSRGTAGDANLLLATRTLATDPFTVAIADPTLANLVTPGDEFDPHLSADGLVLYYAPDPGTGQVIKRASRASRTAAFVIDRTLTELAEGTTYSDPSVSPDELVIAYAATSAAVLYYATRTSTVQPFGTPVQIPVVNGAGRQTDTELSNDGCELYFASTRTGTKRIYVSTITP